MPVPKALENSLPHGKIQEKGRSAVMLRLRPYTPCDAQTIVTWLKSETAFRQWCADRHTEYPLAAETLNVYLCLTRVL